MKRKKKILAILMIVMLAMAVMPAPAVSAGLIDYCYQKASEEQGLYNQLMAFAECVTSGDNKYEW